MSTAHRVYLSLGSNLGDRQANILQALQYVRTRATISGISSFYESEPVGFQNQPFFLNIACEIETELSPRALLEFLKWIEKRLGRRASFRNAPRPIDLDILFYDEQVLQEADLTIPHPRLHERRFVLAPLAEIAPRLGHPLLGKTIEGLLEEAPALRIRRLERTLKLRLDQDVQESRPAVLSRLSRVGITHLNRIIQIGERNRHNLFYAEMNLFADLDPDQAGMHMSRFSDIVEELLEEISLTASPDIESLAEHLARQIVQRQDTIRSEVHIRVQAPINRVAPASGRKMKEVYTLIGIASSSQARTRHLVGVETEGLTVCPCAQSMVRDYSQDLLREEGFSDDQIRRILDTIPIASHNQRGRGTLLLGTEHPVRAENLLHIVEASMSSEIYELLKREDEFFIVNKAHRNPRFVEDVVREMLRNVIEIYPDLPDGDFVLSRQENFESIHRHNAFAEHCGTLGELRREILGNGKPARYTSLEEWLKE
jgi:GTP cyclohydrolase-4